MLFSVIIFGVMVSEVSMVDWQGIAALVGAIAGGLGLKQVVAELIKYVKEKRDRDRKNQGVWSDYHTNYSMVYGCLTDILKHTAADRVLIIENKNGGGKPHLNSTIYSTVKHEVFEGTLGSMEDDWKDQVLDREYLEMLREMDKEGVLNLTMNDLGDGILKGLYFSQGIVGSRIYRLSDKFDRYVYLVANYCTALDVDSKADDVFRRNVNTLQRLYDSE